MTPRTVSSLSARFLAFTQRLRLGQNAGRILHRASRLELNFTALPPPSETVWWDEGLPLYHLIALPRGALSGPVQDDKAPAYELLNQLVQTRQISYPSFDLRWINGLYTRTPIAASTPISSFEELVATPECRPHARIISYRDFERTLSQALSTGPLPLQLREANWRGSRLFWHGPEQHVCAFAGAVAYARLRGLEYLLPAELTSYYVDQKAVETLGAAFHVLAVHSSSWNERSFVKLLIDNAIPYARLTLPSEAEPLEWLLLPRQSPLSDALGQGLLMAGAPDVLERLRQLQPASDTFQTSFPLPNDKSDNT
ncbi:hypothetical protein IQ22_02471 [Pseudomonas duriflava]|uniref:Uncharacterized protein n=1 Tax=Pseudomonas duriflava TaxID=459528 RepID=A0A562QCG8_9PSED|nr:hypothetical protein [Pseudomonas duriflava]TWI53860.1 hypothetical protein IQ22_02471 [Pseudomonas duriflava]